MGSLMGRVAAVLTAAALAGCGGGGPEVEPPKMASVTGVVLVDGTPAEGVSVTFQPVDGGAVSAGTTDEAGEYTLKLQSGSIGEIPGATIGRNRVVISTERFPEYGDDSPRPIVDGRPETIAPQYNKNTTLTADVVEGENFFDFDVDSLRR